MTEWYEPPHVSQLDGSECQGSNCWAAVGAWQADGATGGRASPTPTQFRKSAGGGSGSSDGTCNSGFEVDVVRGLRAIGVGCRLIRVKAARFRRLVREERSAVYFVATDYELWPPEQKPQPTFMGNHAVGIIPGVGNAGRVATMNPLAADYQRIEPEAILRAALKFSRDHGRDGLIWLVRVYRPAQVTESTPADRVRIAELEREVEELKDALDDAYDGAQALALSLEEHDQEGR